MPQQLNLNIQRRKAFWGETTPEGWLFLAQQYKANHNFELHGRTLKANCIHHSESTPSMYVSTSKGFVKCFGCDYFEYDPIRFTQDLTNAPSEEEALSIFISHFGISLSRQEQRELSGWRSLQKTLHNISEAMHLALVNAEPYEPWAKPAIDWLLKRKLDHYKKLPIGILAEPTIINKYLEHDDAKVYAHLFMHCFSNWAGSIAYTYFATPSDISGFKLRRDFMLTGETSLQSIRFINAADTGYQGFFLLGEPIYTSLLGHERKKHIRYYIVEGETDALQWYQKMVHEQESVDVMVLGSGGSGGACLDPLKAFGIDDVFLVADHPRFNGERVLTGYMKLTHDVYMKCLEWPPGVTDKDPDDYLKNHSYDQWKKLVYDVKNEERFVPVHKWSLQRALTKLKSCTELRHKIETIAYYGLQINDPAERDLYIIATSEATGISELRVRRTLVSQEDTMDGFLARIERHLCNEYTFIGYKHSSQGGVILVWHDKKQEMVKWQIGRQRDLETNLSFEIGSFYEWVSESIGIPSWLRLGPRNIPRSIPDIEAKLREYVDMAVKNIKKSLPNINNTEIKREGVHWLYDTKTKEWGLYIVNGKKRFKGTFDETGTLRWTDRVNPVVGDNILFSGRKWTDCIESIEDLERMRNVDPKSILDKVKHILDIGWTFAHQTEDVDFMANSLYALQVMNAMPRQVLIIINAPRESGKSTLLKGLMSGEQNPAIKLLENTIFFGEDYTAASLRQQLRGVGLHPLLDEFEDKDNGRQSLRIRELLCIFRGMVGASSKIYRGSRDGETPIEYTLRFSPVVAAINPLKDSADITRFCNVNLIQVPGRESPDRSILREFSAEEIELLKAQLLIRPYYDILKIQEMYEKLMKTLSTPEYVESIKKSTNGAVVNMRFLGNIVTQASVEQLYYNKGLKFVANFLSSREDALHQHNLTAEHYDLYQTILSVITDWHKINRDNGEFYVERDTVRNLLSSISGRQIINENPCGLRYVHQGDNHWLIVHWHEIINGLLKQAPSYRTANPSSLRHHALDSPNALPMKKVKRAYSIAKLFGVGTNLTDVSGFDVTREINEYDEPFTPESEKDEIAEQ